MAEIPPAPTFKDVLAARKRIAPYVPRTPLHHYAALSKFLGARYASSTRTIMPWGPSRCAEESTCCRS